MIDEKALPLKIFHFFCDTAPWFPKEGDERARVATRGAVCAISQSRTLPETKRRMKLNSAVQTAEGAEHAEKSPDLVNLFACFQQQHRRPHGAESRGRSRWGGSLTLRGGLKTTTAMVNKQTEGRL